MIHTNHIQATEGSKPPMIFISSVYEGWSVAPIESKIMFQSSIFSAHRIIKSSTDPVFTLSSYL